MSALLLLDFYVDEPACLGVPPYISPYVRNVAGALTNAGHQVDYVTVDEHRINDYQIEPDRYGFILIIAGCTVPGRYLGGKPGSAAEAARTAEKNPAYRHRIALGGPLVHSPAHTLEMLEQHTVSVIRGSIETYAARFTPEPASEDYPPLNYAGMQPHALAGANIVKNHFRFPFAIAEMETYRGCTRTARCSFCSEIFYGRPVFRSLEHIFDEAQALYENGIRYFRLGRQADLFSYQADMNDIQNGFPRPNPDAIEKLYRGFRERAPGLKVLHMDNANPGVIGMFPGESSAIAEIICEYNTPLDTAAMGIESADEAVVNANRLKAGPGTVKQAIRIVNRAGSKNPGLPKLTAGLNFIGGLPGESKKTWENNYRFLHELMEEGAILRRINIRKLNPIPGTLAAKETENRKRPGSLDQRFAYFKERVRSEIDPVMLKRIFPVGSLLHEVIPEKRTAGGFLGRQIGSYPITCHIWAGPALLQSDMAERDHLGPFRPLTIMVTGYKERALYGVALEDDYTQWGEYLWKKLLPAGLAREIAENGFQRCIDSIPGTFSPLKKQLIGIK